MKKGALLLSGCATALILCSAASAQVTQSPALPGPPQPVQPPPLIPEAPPPIAAGQPTPIEERETLPATRVPTNRSTIFWQGQIARPQAVTAGTRSVADDPRPEWDPLGIPVGALLVYPSVGVEGLYKTNVRATRIDKIDDVAAVATAALAAQTNWGRHLLAAEGYFRRTEFARLEDEGRSEYGAVARARYDISAVSSLHAIAQYDRLTQAREDINSPVTALRPAQVDRIRGNLSYQRDNGLTLLDADVTVDRRVYRNTVSFTGALLDQHDRDFTRYQASLRFGYAISGSTSLVAATSLNKRDFDELRGTLDRSSKGGTIEAGVLWRPSSLLSAEVRAGYLFQRFKSPRLEDASGLSLTASAVWNALPLTSFRLEVARKISEAASPGVEGQILTVGTFGIDREILPNLIASAEANYERTKFIGIPRKSELFSAGIKGRYMMSRLTVVTFSIEHVRRTATIRSDRFSGQQARLGVRFTL